MAAHYVYRVYDAEGRLIYVGSTGNLVQRLRFHSYGYTAWWNYQASKTVAKVYPDERAARDAEMAAIRSERPRWNITGKWCTNADWTETEFSDYVEALLNSPEFGPGTLRRARRVAAVCRDRIGRDLPVDWDSAQSAIDARISTPALNARYANPA